MSARDLVAHARRVAEPHFTDGDLILELAARLDDTYVFEAPANDHRQQEMQT